MFAENASSPRRLQELSTELISYTERKKLHLKVISDVVLKDFSMWGCGWSRNVFGKNDTVLLNIDAESLEVQFKTKRTNRNADLQTIMAPFRDFLLFTSQGGHKMYSFNEKSRHTKKVYEDDSLRIKAMCCTDEHIYVMDTKSNPCVRVFNSEFKLGYVISIGDKDTRNCHMDMCIVDNTIFISTPKPVASVKALRQNQIIWQANSTTIPGLTLHFDPCSVASSVTGDVLVADRGTNKVCALCVKTNIYSAQSLIFRSPGYISDVS